MHIQINDSKYLFKQIKTLYRIIHSSLTIILRKITKILEIEKIKRYFSINIQERLEMKIMGLKKNIEYKQKLNEKMEKRIIRLGKTMKRMNTSYGKIR